MRDRGHHVLIAAPARSVLMQRAAQAGLSRYPIPVGITAWPRLLPLFLRVIRQEQVQVVHTHGSQDSWMASIAGRLSLTQPVIIRARHKSTPIAPSVRHDMLYSRLPHAVVTTGESVRHQLIRDNGLDATRVFSIPTGVDLRQFRISTSRVNLRRSLGLNEADPVVGTVTFLRPEKGLQVFVEAIGILRKQFPHLRGVIVGDGPESEPLQRMARERRLERVILFAGMREDVPHLLRLLDVFVLPSLEEGIPQSLTQALAMECAIVASRVGGVPEVVHDGQTGLLVPAGDAVSLADKTAYLLLHPQEGQRMGQAGRAVIEQDYSREKMLDRTEWLYGQLLQRWARPAA